MWLATFTSLLSIRFVMTLQSGHWHPIPFSRVYQLLVVLLILVSVVCEQPHRVGTVFQMVNEFMVAFVVVYVEVHDSPSVAFGRFGYSHSSQQCSELIAFDSIVGVEHEDGFGHNVCEEVGSLIGQHLGLR